MEEKTRKSLINVIDYMWRDEAESFFDSGEPENHVFMDLMKLKIYSFRPETSARNVTVEMCADSPFDLASEEDNKYRDLVDKLLNN